MEEDIEERIAACSGSRSKALMCEGRISVVASGRSGGIERGGFARAFH